MTTDEMTTHDISIYPNEDDKKISHIYKDNEADEAQEGQVKPALNNPKTQTLIYAQEHGRLHQC